MSEKTSKEVKSCREQNKDRLEKCKKTISNILVTFQDDQLASIALGQAVAIGAEVGQRETIETMYELQEQGIEITISKIEEKNKG